jgi:hypothetical protein
MVAAPVDGCRNPTGYRAGVLDVSQSISAIRHAQSGDAIARELLVRARTALAHSTALAVARQDWLKNVDPSEAGSDESVAFRVGADAFAVAETRFTNGPCGSGRVVRTIFRRGVSGPASIVRSAYSEDSNDDMLLVGDIDGDGTIELLRAGPFDHVIVERLVSGTSVPLYDGGTVPVDYCTC